MRVNVSSLSFAPVSAVADLEYIGPRDPKGNWQDRPRGCDGSIERDEECYVKYESKVSEQVYLMTCCDIYPWKACFLENKVFQLD